MQILFWEEFTLKKASTLWAMPKHAQTFWTRLTVYKAKHCSKSKHCFIIWQFGGHPHDPPLNIHLKVKLLLLLNIWCLICDLLLTIYKFLLYSISILIGCCNFTLYLTSKTRYCVVKNWRNSFTSGMSGKLSPSSEDLATVRRAYSFGSDEKWVISLYSSWGVDFDTLRCENHTLARGF